MTRKHFEAIAGIFAEHAGAQGYEVVWEEGYDAAHSMLAMELAAYFQTVNPNFDRVRFLVACEVENS